MAKHEGRAARPAFALVKAASACFVIGLICTYLSHSSNVPDWASRAHLGSKGSLSSVVAALGDALIIAAVLSVVVEPYLRRRFTGEFGRDIFWAIFSPDAPPEFRKALQTQAQPDVYWLSCYWVVNLSWVDGTREVLRVNVTVEATGKNLSRKGYMPDKPAWVLSTHDGKPSRYLRFRYKLQDSARPAIDLREPQIPPLKSSDDGRWYFLESQVIPADMTVPYQSNFEITREIETTRRASDFFPLYHGYTALAQELRICGPAFADLKIAAFPFEENARQDETDLAGSAAVFTCGVTFPGQATVIVWTLQPSEYFDTPIAEELERSISPGDGSAKSPATTTGQQPERSEPIDTRHPDSTFGLG